MDIVIPIFDGFTALDAVGPIEVLSQLPDAQLTVVARRRGEVRNDSNTMGMMADASLDEVSACDVLLVPGGPATRRLIHDRDLCGWIAALSPTASWTTSVCTGSLLLAAASLLDGRKATTHWSAVELLQSFGVLFVDERVVEDGPFMTAAGVSSGIDMALTLAAKLAGDRVAMAIQLGIEYDPKPPFQTGSVHSAPPEIVDLVRTLLRSTAAVEASQQTTPGSARP